MRKNNDKLNIVKSDIICEKNIFEVVENKSHIVKSSKEQNYDAIFFSSLTERQAQEQLTSLLCDTPIPHDELLENLGLYLTSKTFSRLLFFHEIYKRIISHHGVIMEFGTRWRQTVSILSALRGIFEPFNRCRKIVGFDTFEGFCGFGSQDGAKCKCADGSYSVSKDYESHLSSILSLQEALNPMSHIKKFELVKGDVRETAPNYLTQHPETIVSLAIFDLDIYLPTKAAIEAIRPYLTSGSILVFDELCDNTFPGETVALRECFDMSKIKIQRLSMTSRLSFIEIP